MQYIFITSNQHKVQELQRILEVPVQQRQIDLPEIQAVDVGDVIEAKAKYAFETVKQPVIVEDTGLSFHAWNGLPGALVTWFLQSVGVDGLCTMLHGFKNREAHAETCIGYYDGVTMHVFRGTVDGTIVTTPRGTGGFGWDPIFVPNGSTQTYAELAAEQKLTVSMRTQAALKFKEYLATQ